MRTETMRCGGERGSPGQRGRRSRRVVRSIEWIPKDRPQRERALPDRLEGPMDERGEPVPRALDRREGRTGGERRGGRRSRRRVLGEAVDSPLRNRRTTARGGVRVGGNRVDPSIPERR